jgi:hypothetical protein
MTLVVVPPEHLDLHPATTRPSALVVMPSTQSSDAPAPVWKSQSKIRQLLPVTVIPAAMLLAPFIWKFRPMSVTLASSSAHVASAVQVNVGARPEVGSSRPITFVPAFRLVRKPAAVTGSA